MLLKINFPGYFELDPSSSSILISWLYFATLSDLDNEPVLICPTEYATDRSAIKVSSVSPDLCDTTELYLLFLAKSIASIVSVNVPI